MKVSLKTSFINEEIARIIKRISSGFKVGNRMGGEDIKDFFQSEKLKQKINFLRLLKEHLEDKKSLLSNYNSTIEGIKLIIEDMKKVVERFIVEGRDKETFENTLNTMYEKIRETAKNASWKGRKIALGGFSNEIISTDYDVSKIDISGINPKKFGIKDGEKFTIIVSGDGQGNITGEIEGKVSERKFQDEETITFDFGLKIALPKNFSGSIKISALAEGKTKFLLGEILGEISLPSLEPEFIAGLTLQPSLENPKKTLGDIINALTFLDSLSIKISSKIKEIDNNSDISNMVLSESEILKSNFSDANLDEESIILQTKNLIMNANINITARIINLNKEVVRGLLR